MIVMGVLTAIPFGLAIRQTLNKSPQAERELEEQMDPSLKYEREMRADMAAREAREVQERAESEQKKKDMRAAQRAVFGQGALNLGTLFDGTKLGAGPETLDAVRARTAQEIEHGISVDFELDAKVLVGVAVRINSYDSDCAGFDEDLQAAWGKPISGAYDRHVWVADSRRGVFDITHCTLFVETFADVPHWIGKGDAIVPLDWIGKPAKPLLAKLGIEPDETMAAWQSVGVGTGTGVTTMTAEIANGKIVALTASAKIDPATRSDIQDRLTKLFGEPKEYPESGADLRWNGKPAVEVTATSRTIELRVGK